MSTAFSVAYPAERGVLGKVFRPLIEPRAYLRSVHLLLMFPLGLAYFVFFVTAFSFGGALVWTLIGPPVLFFAMFVSLYLGDMEAWMVCKVAGVSIHRPPKVLEGVTSFRQKVWARVIDPATWTGLFYEFAQFPIGVASLVVVITGFSVAGFFVAAPVLEWQLADRTLEDTYWGLSIDSPLEALALVPVGILALLVTLHLVTAFSVLHAFWAGLMLGSKGRRAPRIEPGGQPAPSTPSPPPSPIALLPPVEPRIVEAELSIDAGVSAGTAPPGLSPGTGEDHPSLGSLTAREREVLLLLARGYTNADIGETCYISEGTVKTHVGNILSKLDLRDRTQVVVFAYEAGIIRPGQSGVALAQLAQA